MKKSRVVGLVTGVHVLAVGGLLLSQGCGTTRAPLPREDQTVMPPPFEEERLVPVVVPPVYRPLPPPPIQSAVEPVVVKPPSETTTYVVAKGDMLSVIAKRYGVSVQDVMLINNITDPNRIRVGQRLELPGRIDVSRPLPVQTERAVVAAGIERGGEPYEIKAGDSLSVIAQRHGVNVQELMRANNISDANRIRVGQKLVIPAGGAARPVPVAPVPPTPAPTPAPTLAPTPAPTAELPAPSSVLAVPAPADLPVSQLLPPAPAAPSAGGRQTYTVVIGDDLLSVASEYNVSIAALKAANNLDSDILVPGRTLVIPDAD
jgi:LysM repeat protein